MVEISVVVICHNDGDVINRCDTELGTILSTLGMPAELVYVDNGSEDDTRFRLHERVKQREKGIPRRVVVLKRYSGLSAAFMAGVQHSTGQFILTIDPALSVDPIEMTRLIEEISQGYDVVLGWRQRQHLPAWIQARSAWFNEIASWITGVHLHDYGTPLRIFRREAVQHIPLQGDLYPFAPVFIQMAGGKLREIRVIYRPEYYIRPEYTANGYITGLLDLLTVWFLSRYLNRPLGFFGRVGIVCFLLAVFLWGLGETQDEKDSRWMAGISFGVGVQAFLMGLNTELMQHRHYEHHQEHAFQVVEVIES